MRSRAPSLETLLGAVLRTLLLLLFMGLPAPAEDQQSPAGGVPTINALRIDKGPLDDPCLRSPAWQSAPLVIDFNQREPHEGERSTERTEVRMIYDERNLYFGIVCYDSEPSRITARQLVRDASQDLDDHFTIIISPSNDHRNGYAFTINPLGTERDELVGNNGQIRDYFWDGVWHGSACRGSDGWRGEVIIPFRTLQTGSRASRAWGLNFERFIRRKNEQAAWSGHQRVYSVYTISQGGELHGVAGKQRWLAPQLRPYLATGFSNPSGQPVTGRLSAGLDGTLNLRNRFQLDFAANPDFSDAPVDSAQLNLAPVSLSLPETRRFFLKRSDLFDFGFGPYMQLFYSRQIGIDGATGLTVPIEIASKLTGSLGLFDVGAIYAKTGAKDSIPGNQFFVGRVKRNLFRSSFVGVMLVDRERPDRAGSHNRAYGTDFNLNFLQDKFTVRGFYARSDTPSLKGQNAIHFVRASYRGNLFNASLGEQVIEPNYRPEAGFINVNDTKATYSSFGLTPRPGVAGIRQISLTAILQTASTSQNISWVRLLNTPISATWNNGSRVDFEPFQGHLQRVLRPLRLSRKITVLPGLYRYVQHNLSYSSDQSKPLIYSSGITWGTLYDGEALTWRAALTFRPTPHWSIDYSHNLTRFAMREVRDLVHLIGLQTNYSFNRQLRMSGSWQYNALQEKPLSASFLFGYRYREDSDLYLVYTWGTRFASIGEGNPELLRVKELAIKLTFSVF